MKSRIEPKSFFWGQSHPGLAPSLYYTSRTLPAFSVFAETMNEKNLLIHRIAKRSRGAMDDSS